MNTIITHFNNHTPKHTFNLSLFTLLQVSSVGRRATKLLSTQGYLQKAIRM